VLSPEDAVHAVKRDELRVEGDADCFSVVADTLIRRVGSLTTSVAYDRLNYPGDILKQLLGMPESSHSQSDRVSLC